MNVVDSSGWLEYFAGSLNADHFAPIIQDTDHLLVPVVIVYEVFKKIAAQFGEEEALRAIGVMQSGIVVDLSCDLAIEAASLSLAHQLPMADSLILATTQSMNATLWTQDAHFAGLDGVRYFQK